MDGTGYEFYRIWIDSWAGKSPFGQFFPQIGSVDFHEYVGINLPKKNGNDCMNLQDVFCDFLLLELDLWFNYDQRQIISVKAVNHGIFKI